MKKIDHKELHTLLKNKDNRVWVWKKFLGRIAVVAGTVLTAWQIFQSFFEEWPPQLLTNIMPAWLVRWFILIMLVVAAIVVLWRSAVSILDFTHIKVQTERQGCTVEVSMADSYLTNAFVKYPKCAMLIGLNDCFWFREAEPKSLVEDMWNKLKEYHIDKEDVQKLIDKELEERLAHGDKILDEDRPQVCIRRTWTRGKDEIEHDAPGFEHVTEADVEAGQPGGPDYVLRANCKTGTVIGVDLRGYSYGKKKKTKAQIWREAKESSLKYKNYKAELKAMIAAEKAANKEAKKATKNGNYQVAKDRKIEAVIPSGKMPQSFWKYYFDKKNRMAVDESKQIPFFKKLYFIANAEVVQGKDTNEPIKVAPDEDRSVVENFENIWKFFEYDEQFNVDPPKTTLYAPLLLPLIGGGVANEGYTDIEIFSKLVDLYFEHMRASIRVNQVPAIRNMIINIRNTTAIDSAQSLNDRQIDMNIAKTYLEYRNKINPPMSRESRGLAAAMEFDEEIEADIVRHSRGDF